MGNEIEKTQTFQEKISVKIKESIGDLITDEDLKPLIEESIEQLLLEPRIINRPGSYGNDTLPPLLQEILTPIITTQIKKAVDTYMAEHPKVFIAIIQDIIKTGFIKTMVDHLDYKMQTPLVQFQQQVSEIFMKHNMGG